MRLKLIPGFTFKQSWESKVYENSINKTTGLQGKFEKDKVNKSEKIKGSNISTNDGTNGKQMSNSWLGIILYQRKCVKSYF